MSRLAAILVFLIALVAAPAAGAASRSLEQSATATGCASDSASPCAPAKALGYAHDVALSPNGQQVYAASFFDDGVVTFARNASTGALTQLAGTAGCVTATGRAYADGPATAGQCTDGRGLSEVTDVVVSSDGEHVYALSIGAGVSGFDRDAVTGELTPILGTAGCINPTTRSEPNDPATTGQCALGRAMHGAFELAISPDGQNVYVASRRDDAVAVLNRNPLTGALAQAAGPEGCVSETGHAVPGDDATASQCLDGKGLLQAEGIAVSPDGGTVYVPASEKATLAVLDRDPITGALANLAGADGCATFGNDGIGNTSYPAPDGFQSCKDAGRSYSYPNAVGVSPDNTSVYTSSADDDSIQGFSRDPLTGALTTIASPGGCIKRYKDYDGCTIQPGISYAAGIAFRPDGRRVYVASADAHNVLSLVRDPATGALSPRGGTASCNGNASDGCAPGRAIVGAFGMAASADGRFVYVASLSSSAVAVFRAVPLQLTPALTDFFIQERDTSSADRSVTVRNDGDASVQISGVSMAGAHPGDFTITGGTCPGPALAPGAACTVLVRFTPKVRGRRSAELRIASNSPTSPDGAEIKGIGIVTLPPPPGVSQLEEVDGCITETGREHPQVAATAGRCRDGRALGVIQNLGVRGPGSILVQPDNLGVYVPGTYRSSDQPLNYAAIARFQRDTTTGLLTQPAGLDGCISRSGDGGTCATASRMIPDLIRLSPDGENAYVLGPMNGFAVFDRDPATGALTQKAGTAGCFTMDGRSIPGDATTAGQCTVARPFNNANHLAVSPDGKNVYATSQAGHSLLVFDRDLDTGALTQKASPAGCFTPDGRGVSTDPATAGECTTAVGIANQLRVLPLNDHVYVVHSPGVGSSTRVIISIFDRDPSTGALTRRTGPGSCIGQDGEGGCTEAKAMNGIVQIKLADSGEHMYVSAFLSESIAILDRNPTTGALTQKAEPDGCISEREGRSDPIEPSTAGDCRDGRALASPGTLDITPDGKLLIGTSISGTDIVNFDTEGALVVLARNTTDGTVTMSGCFTESTRSNLGDPVTTGECVQGRAVNALSGLDITPDGKHVYASSRTRQGVALFRILNEPGPAPGPAVSVGDVAVLEGDAGTSTMTFTLALAEPAIRATTIDWQTVDEIATAGSDYVAASGTANIAQGETEATVAVTINGDGVDEEDETLGLEVTDADGAVLGDERGQGTIQDDDQAAAVVPVVSAGGASVAEGDGGERDLSLTVSLSSPVVDTVTVEYAVTPGTASAGADYAPRDGLAAIPPGETSVSVLVPVVGDDADETNETVMLTLSAPDGATLGTAVASGQILDDDDPPATGGGGSGPPPGSGAGPPPAEPAPPETLTPAPVPTPTPTPVAAVKANVGLPATRRCASRRRFRIQLRAPAKERIVRVAVLVNGKPAKGVKPTSARVDLRGLPKGTVRVTATITTASGKVLTDTRRYKTCAPKKRGK